MPPHAAGWPHDRRSLSPTARSTVRRIPHRARTDRADLHAVLDAGLVCHLGLVVRRRAGRAPHRATAASTTPSTCTGPPAPATLRAASTASPVCVTVTHVDGIVYARSVFHHSMNYRSAVVHGTARLVTDPDERLAGLRAHRRAPVPRLVGARPRARPPRAGRHRRVRARPHRGQRQGAHRPAVGDDEDRPRRPPTAGPASCPSARCSASPSRARCSPPPRRSPRTSPTAGTESPGTRCWSAGAAGHPAG